MQRIIWTHPFFVLLLSIAVRPDIQVTGLVGHECNLFTSKLYPLLASFTTVGSNSTYKVGFFMCIGAHVYLLLILVIVYANRFFSRVVMTYVRIR